MRGLALRALPAALRTSLVACAWLAPAAGCGGTAPSTDGARSAVLVTLDTTRADALGAYGMDGARTPTLDRIAREGTVYEAAYTVAPLTMPSHASMLTGLVPPRHGVRDNGLWALPEEATTLAELARDAGLATGAFLGSVVLDEGFGLDQGFERYVAPERSESASLGHYAERPSSEVVDDAIAWLDGLAPGRGFLLWVHLWDPHYPYEPPEDLARAFPGKPYAGEVAAADRALARLVARLEATGDLERTTLLVVADHGEAFGEHGEETHALYCYEPTLRVPLLLRRPGGEGGGRRVETLASVVDVHPTLASALGLAAAPGHDGWDLWSSAPDGERGVYFESYYGYLAFGWSPLVGWRDASGKYVHSSRPELYDVAADPSEARDLAAQRDAAPYREAIRAALARPALEVETIPSRAEDGLRSQVAALGYASTSAGAARLPEPLAETTLPSPRERAQDQERMRRAFDLLSRDRPAEARAVYEAVLAEGPGNPTVLARVGICLMREGRPAEALPFLRRAAAAGPPRADISYSLGLVLAILNREDEAREAFVVALEVDPNHPLARRALEALDARRGR